MLRRTPLLAVLLSVLITAITISPTQAAAPDVTAITPADSTIYPSVNTAELPGSTTITVDSTDPADVEYLDIRNAADTLAIEITLAGSTTTSWNGRDTGGSLVAAGDYTLIALNSAHEAAAATGTITVSRQHLVQKTFTKVVPANQYFYKFIGPCSSLRKPSRRGWRGSLGYYANTRCKTQTWNASRVITLHEVQLPVAQSYVDMRVDTYGGAAKSKPGSRGETEYFQSDSNLTAPHLIGGSVGWHSGLTRGANSLVTSDRWVAWRMCASFKSQYDVSKFRLVVHYEVLS